MKKSDIFWKMYLNLEKEAIELSKYIFFTDEVLVNSNGGIVAQAHKSQLETFSPVSPNLNYGVESIDITDVNVDVKQKIKIAIVENSKVTQRELVVKLGVSYRQIQQNMAEMVSDGEIVRVGSNRSGHWEIIE